MYGAAKSVTHTLNMALVWNPEPHLYMREKSGLIAAVAQIREELVSSIMDSFEGLRLGMLR